MTPTLGSLRTVPAADRPDLLAPSVPAAAAALGPDAVGVAEIDASLSDTAAFCAAYDVPAAGMRQAVLADPEGAVFSITQPPGL